MEYSEWLHVLNLPKFKARHHILKLYYLYKILNGLAFHQLSCYFHQSSEAHKLAEKFNSLLQLLTAWNLTVKIPVFGTIYLTKLSKLWYSVPPLCISREYACRILNCMQFSSLDTCLKLPLYGTAVRAPYMYVCTWITMTEKIAMIPMWEAAFV